MNYIVFDLEFNMFFPFREGESANPDLKNEIIQIGAVKLNEKLETIAEFDLLIKPVIYKRINPFVKRKTNINTSQVARGTLFPKAIESFNTWIGNEAVLCSWGHDDILALRDNCLFFGFNSISFDKFINIQQIYMNYESLTQQPSLEGAVEGLEIEISSPFHDALSDASYTAKIFKKVYDSSSNPIINWERIQKENEEKLEDLKTLLDKADIRCPGCGRFVPKDTEVTKLKKYFAFGYCAECKIHIRHVSRITHKDGEYSIFSKNAIYKTDELGSDEKITPELPNIE
ncbi:3'-5' exonuclease [Desulfosporosinus sp. Sb-LF]|uniref:3'-5' exonuclease n=1 Tax=Desulfosporosinus sp. Sb-LF TaxID=2560027 RepID=UPI00107F142B|nr:3'-5' exonuclease [Desulfosporosinus sp. Sb-LF]TGE33689.1 exonuclease domain-containing protein [Desulfosporosinus sp. Sb-LF]